MLAELEYDSMPELEYDSEPEFDLAAGGVGVSSESENFNEGAHLRQDRFDTSLTIEDNYGEGRHMYRRQYSY